MDACGLEKGRILWADAEVTWRRKPLACVNDSSVAIWVNIARLGLIASSSQSNPVLPYPGPRLTG